MNPRWAALPKPASGAAALAELRARNALLRELLGSLPVAVLAWDWEQRQVLLANAVLNELAKLTSIYDPDPAGQGCFRALR